MKIQRVLFLKIVGTIGLIVLLLTPIITSNEFPITSNVTMNNQSSVIALDDTVEIYSDDDFVSQSWPGNGILGDPFLISGLEIGDTDGPSIDIQNTRAYFIVSDCHILETTYGTGITLRNVSNAEVFQCTIDNGYLGLFNSENSSLQLNVLIGSYVSLSLSGSSHCVADNNELIGMVSGSSGSATILGGQTENCTISNNNVSYGTHYGIDLHTANDASIINNSISGYAQHGIRLYMSNNILIHGNNISDCIEAGIYLYYSDNAVVSNCTVIDCGYSIYNYYADYPTFHNSTFENCGLGYREGPYEAYEIDSLNVFVNGKPLGVFLDLSDMAIDSSIYGQILVYDCYNLTFTGGSFHNCSGIIGAYNYKCTFSDISVVDSYNYGVDIFHGQSCNYTRLTISDSRLFDFSMKQSQYCNVSDSTFGNAGFRLRAWGANSPYFDHTMYGNTVDGKELATFFFEEDMIIDISSFGQVIIGNCNNVTLTNGYFEDIHNPIQVGICNGSKVENSFVSGSLEVGIHIDWSTYIEVSNCEVYNTSGYDYNTGHGIFVLGSDYCKVKSNTLVNNERNDLKLWSSDETIVEDNSITSTTAYQSVHNEFSPNSTFVRNRISGIGDGIYVDESSRVHIEDNEFRSEHYCVYLKEGHYTNVTGNSFIDNQYSGGVFAYNIHNLTVEKNFFNVSNSAVYGFNFEDSDFHANIISEAFNGFNIRDSSNLMVTENQMNFTRNGIVFNSVSSSNIIGNKLYCGIDTGISLKGTSSQNVIYDNEIAWFMNNNGFDEGTDNQWDDGISKGNAWSDYSGTGTYPVDGTANSIDHYPSQILDNIAPAVSGCDDVLYLVDEFDQWINWTVSDLYEYEFSIEQNGTEVDSGEWNTGLIEYNVTGLELGNYNFTITLSDYAGNIATDTIFVYVVTELPTTTTTTTTTTTISTTTGTTTNDTTTDPVGPLTIPIEFIVIGGALVAVVVVLILVKRR